MFFRVYADGVLIAKGAGALDEAKTFAGVRERSARLFEIHGYDVDDANSEDSPTRAWYFDREVDGWVEGRWKQASASFNQTVAERLADGHVTISNGIWRETFPEDQREIWIDWYDRMFGQYGYDGYRDLAAALRSLDPETE
ncbi:hypothetical protein LA6_002200 [Marinibacterium anthonyi]|nr:hypothetical protein LA6_002200 [Marinibacterium anthonyi]